MNIASFAINSIGLVFLAYLVWIFYQLYLAAWGKDNAKEKWLVLMGTSFGLLIQPFFKWFILVLFAISSFVLILFSINVLMQLTLVAM
ncbi:MAG: hypothetical protein AB8B89_04335 [Gammaproteobacteria bacterium]